MTINQASTILKFANIQMAAEAIFGFDPKIRTLTPGEVVTNRSITAEDLTAGNLRTNAFAAVPANEFKDQFRIVEHKSNTVTGFSGTLFEYIGPNDPLSGFVTGN